MDVRLAASAVLSVCLHGIFLLLLADRYGVGLTTQSTHSQTTFGRLSVTVVKTNPLNDAATGGREPSHSSVATSASRSLSASKGKYVPPLLLSIEEEGTVVPLIRSAKGGIFLRISVSSDGQASAVHVDRSNLPKDIEQQIVTQFFYAKYRAAEIDGSRVNGEMSIRIELDPFGGSVLADPLLRALPAR